MNDLRKVKFLFVCPDNLYTQFMERRFAQDPNWGVRQDYFENIEGHDTLVTAGNSYGIMDGGIDLAVREYFGKRVQVAVQDVIESEYLGILPVGSAVSVPVFKGQWRNLIYAPTMRLPMAVNKTNFVFYAAMATFRAIAQNPERIERVVIPAFGALTGKVSATQVAKQIHAAWVQATGRYHYSDWTAVSELENTLTSKYL